MILVHHLENSRSQRILWLLEELGVAYEIKHYARDKATTLAPPELTEIHPLGKSPMIELDGTLITESAAIVEILCAKFAPEMVPPIGTEAYIRHLELMHFAEGSAMTPILIGLYTARLGEAAAPLKPRLDHQLAAHFSHMENTLRDSGHFVLDQLSAADIMLSFPAEIAIKQGHGDRFPKLAKFVAWIHKQDAFKRAITKGGPYRFE